MESQPPPDKASQPALSAQFLHDARTPLNQIIGYTEMLTEQAHEEGQTGFVPDLQSIRRAARQLLALLNSHAPSPHATVGHRSESSQVPFVTPHLSDAQFAPASHDAALPAETAQPTANLETESLLVVDDIEANRDVLMRRLERQGYAVAAAKNGREALAMLEKQPFDMVLLDIMMPEMDGYEVLQTIKASDQLCHIPVIMISALHEIEGVVRCIEMGAEDYLSKPFEPTLLKARISASLEKKRARDREKRLFDQLQQNHQRLQELEKLRDDLTHMIIHDLRTPLGAVTMGMQALEVVGELNEVQRDLMNIALTGGESLLSLINELLDVEKMESGSMQLSYSRLDAAELIAAATSQINPLIEPAKLTLVRQIESDLPPFQGDENKLIRTLVNLLGNAIKFTPPGGTLSIAARQSDDTKSLIFSVTDTGPGIPSEAFERIFQKFGQVESRQSGRSTSTGLGLAFCKLTVAAHGGTIGVESVVGSGSTFFFTVPLNDPNPTSQR